MKFSPLRLLLGNNDMRVLELFAGYGSQALALENLGIDFTSDISEIDKYAIQAYNQLHGDTYNWGDITKIDETKLPYYDLITYSSPCQDFSVAGLQKGGDAGSGTRSSLLWECERIIRAVKPKYLLMENVKNLVGKKHIHNFIRWLQVLEMMGYQNYWQVLNAKDYGVPQNRERVFVVSILGCGQYLFPNPIKLEKRLKDVLEPVVNEKYYLSSKIIEGFLKRTEQQKQIKGGYIFQPSDGDCVGKTITGCNDNRITDNYICIGGMQKHQSITTDGVSTCLCSSMGQGGGYVPMIINNEPNVLTPKRTEYGKQIRKDYENGTVKESRHNMTELEPRDDGISNTLTSVQKDNLVAEPNIIEEPYNLYPNSGNPQAGRVYNPNGISPAMDTCSGGNRMPKIVEMFNPYNNSKIDDIAPTQTTQCDHKTTSSTVLVKYDNYHIRKLTPRECWRLMGVKDEQFNKLHGISNSQLYKLAGNSIVVDVLMGIFKNLFLKNESTGQLSLFGGNE